MVVEIGIGLRTAVEAEIDRRGHRMAVIGLRMAAEGVIGPSVRVTEIGLRVRLTGAIGRRAGIGRRIGVVGIGIGLRMATGLRVRRIAGEIGLRGLLSAGIDRLGRLMVAGASDRRVLRTVAIGRRVGIDRFGLARRTTVRVIGRFGLGFRNRADLSATSASPG